MRIRPDKALNWAAIPLRSIAAADLGCEAPELSSNTTLHAKRLSGLGDSGTNRVIAKDRQAANRIFQGLAEGGRE